MSHSTASVRPMSCQPPGVSRGVDAAEFARQRDRSGGHAGPRLVASRHVEARVAADEIGEARDESAERHPPWHAGVGRDDTGGAESGDAADLLEIGAVVDDVEHHVGHARGGAAVVGRQPQLLDVLPRQRQVTGAVDLDQHRSRRRHDVGDTEQVGLPQRGRGRQHLGGALEFQQQGVIAVVEHPQIGCHTHLLKVARISVGETYP